MEFKWERIERPDQVSGVIEDFGRHDLLGWDFETTGLDFTVSDIHGMGLANEDQAWYIMGNVLPMFKPWLKDMMHNPEVSSIAHNAKFDLHFLKKLDPTIKPVKLIDTMVAQWLIDENEKLGLKSMAEYRLGIEGLLEFSDMQKITKANNPDKFSRYKEVSIYDFDIDMLSEYGAKDPWMCVQMWPELQWELVQEDQEKLFTDIEMPFVFLLQKMEATGFYVYTDKLLELKEEWTKQHQILEEQWREKTKDSDFPDGRNPNSSIQVSDWFYEINNLPISIRTDSGKGSTKALAIMRLSHIDPTGTAQILLAYRELNKLISTYVNPFLERTNNGYIHGNYNHTGTVTGRLSSNDPNLQNIPAHGELGGQVRWALGAPPDQDYLMIDYSQMELRLAAHYARVSALMKTFIEGGDPHQTTADLVGVPRYIAKNLNFAWFYGAGPRKFCDMVEETGQPRPAQEDAKQWFYQFGEAYPELVDWKFAVLRAAKKLGYVKTMLGRRRHLEDLKSYDHALRGRAERQAVNSVIQGSAGDLIKWAMLEIDPLMDDYGAQIVDQVHDELGFFIPKEASYEFSLIVQEKMEAVEERFNIRVPIVAEPIIAQTWGETKGD